MTAPLLGGATVLVTGAGGRLGRRLVGVLAGEAAIVVAADLDRAAAEAAAAASPGAVAVELDVTDEDGVERAIDAAEAEVGEITALVNCHGFVPSATLLEMDAAVWDRVFAVNVRGTMLMTRAMARRWVARGVRGAVVNLSSIAARSARPGASHYCSSKAAVSMMTEAFAGELGPHGIRVNAVAPGLVMDEVHEEPAPGLHPYAAAMLEATPLGRTGSPDEIADAIAFLLSERSIYTTGAVLDITGGLHCGRTCAPLSGDM
jgi:NAD(P)-dependent dehydrogenase (short-subunit alcohol dehydrogenase family)